MDDVQGNEVCALDKQRHPIHTEEEALTGDCAAGMSGVQAL